MTDPDFTHSEDFNERLVGKGQSYLSLTEWLLMFGLLAALFVVVSIIVSAIVG